MYFHGPYCAFAYITKFWQILQHFCAYLISCWHIMQMNDLLSRIPEAHLVRGALAHYPIC